MRNRQQLVEVNRAIAYVQRHWQEVRAVAGKAFKLHGRGAFLFDLSHYQNVFEAPPFELTYLGMATANGAQEWLTRYLLSSELEEYDPGRQVVFVFWEPESEDGFIRVLTETPDGKPLMGLDRRWFNATRSCPECGKDFFSKGPWGQCPQCSYEFEADYSNQKTEMGHVPPIVECS